MLDQPSGLRLVLAPSADPAAVLRALVERVDGHRVPLRRARSRDALHPGGARMRIDPIVTIAKREYLSRVKSQGLLDRDPPAAARHGGAHRPAVADRDEVARDRSASPSSTRSAATASGWRRSSSKRSGRRPRAAKLVERRRRPSEAETAQLPGRARRRAPAIAPRSAPSSTERVLAGEIDAWLWLSPEGVAGKRGRVSRRERLELHDPEPPRPTSLSEVVGEARLEAAGHRRRRGRRADPRGRARDDAGLGRGQPAGRAAWPASSSPTSSSSCSTW